MKYKFYKNLRGVKYWLTPSMWLAEHQVTEKTKYYEAEIKEAVITIPARNSIDAVLCFFKDQPNWRLIGWVYAVPMGVQNVQKPKSTMETPE